MATVDYTRDTISLPAEFVESSVGFALDVGCSTAKLVFRSNSDYKDGKPIKDELKTGQGRIHVISSIVNTRLDEVLQLILDESDIKREGDEPPVVLTTGGGCSLYRKKIEKTLNVKLRNMMEFDCFTQGFHLLGKHTEDAEKLFLPESEEIKEETRKKIEKAIEKFKNIPKEYQMDFVLESEEEKCEDTKEEKPVFPCVLAMCGSGIGYMKLDETGTCRILDGSFCGGRFFLGLSSLLVGETDFKKLYRLIEEGNGRTTDETFVELVGAGDDDGYSNLSKLVEDDDDNDDKEVQHGLALGKAINNDRKCVKDCDVIWSVYHVMVKTIMQLGFLHCQLADIPNLYFCGNLINNSKAKKWIETEAVSRNAMSSKDKKVNVRLIQHGGSLGSIGAFVYDPSKKINAPV